MLMLSVNIHSHYEITNIKFVHWHWSHSSNNRNGMDAY